jgi:ketosteroid isomerase-like protein
MLQRAEQGKKLIREQKYEIRSEIARDQYVAVEAFWTATIAIPVGDLPAGSKMEAHFAMFFEIREGRILSQRNYDCFLPW